MRRLREVVCRIGDGCNVLQYGGRLGPDTRHGISFRPAAESTAFAAARHVAQHGRAAGVARPARQVRAAGLLDLLLHQLHAHPAGAAQAGAGVAEEPGGDRRPFGQVLQRTADAEHPARPSSATRSSTRSSTMRGTSCGRRSACRHGRRWCSSIPEGNAIWGTSGEVTFEQLDKVLRAAMPYYRQRRLLDETPLRFDMRRRAAAATPLRFPGKIIADEASDRLFVADSNHNRIVVARLRRHADCKSIGIGARGAEGRRFR